MPDGTAPLKPITPSDLAEIGEAVYGAEWRPALAGWLGIPIDSLKSWATGRRTPRDLEQYRLALLDLVEAHEGRLQALAQRLRGKP